VRSLQDFKTYDLPEQGQFKTDQGAELSVVQLNQNNIPNLNTTNQLSSNNLVSLFNNQQNIYRLTAGDVLPFNFGHILKSTHQSKMQPTSKAVGYPIDSMGNVQLPLVGSVHIAGKTLAETNRFLHNQFAKYLKHPDVVVRVLSYEGRRYFVNGQVIRSGQYTLNDQPISIYTALGQAGGIDTKTGDTTNIQLIRNGQTYNLNTIQLEKQGLSLHQLLIQPNDTIFVNTKQDQNFMSWVNQVKAKHLFYAIKA
jgi:polysaccharide export outer membrane protein